MISFIHWHNKRLCLQFCFVDSELYRILCLFEALRPGQYFFSHFGMASWV